MSYINKTRKLPRLSGTTRGTTWIHNGAPQTFTSSTVTAFLERFSRVEQGASPLDFMTARCNACLRIHSLLRLLQLGQRARLQLTSDLLCRTLRKLILTFV
jgi:hypothetical protein